MDKFNIGDICFCWDCKDYELKKGEYFERFRVSDSTGMEEICFNGVVEYLNKYTYNKSLMTDYSFELYEVDNEKLLMYHWSKCWCGFAIWPDRISHDKVNTCIINTAMKDDLPMETDWFFGLIGLNKTLLQKAAPVLHASYIDYNGEAVLFTAPSQTGKSTQADLWQKNTDAEIINGDRVLLKKRDGIWHAYGYPCCGSSKICINRTLPIKAIVVLEQAEENQIIELSKSEKVRNLMTGIAIYRWDIEQVDMSIMISEKIASEVNIIKLRCRPDADAVEVLKQFLEG